MYIYQDILKQGKRLTGGKAAGKFKVIDTLSTFWQQIGMECSKAKVLDASALLDSIAEVCRYTYNYERSVDYGNIAPVHPVTWVELKDTETAVNLAALIIYQENTGQSGLAEQAREHGIHAPFRWCCSARSFLKKNYGQTLPLKWEWIEYIDSSGHSVGSLMKPMIFPEGFGQLVQDEMEQMRFVHHDLCALVANLGLYTIDMLNNNIASLSTCQTVNRPKRLLAKPSTLEHEVVQLNFSNNPLRSSVPILQG